MPYPSVPEIARNWSPLCNPFTGRKWGAMAIPHFRTHLNILIQRHDKLTLAALDDITDTSVLACWCIDLAGDDIFSRPEVCHCQVIWKAWAFLNRRPGGTLRDPLPHP